MEFLAKASIEVEVMQRTRARLSFRICLHNLAGLFVLLVRATLYNTSDVVVVFENDEEEKKEEK